MSFQLRFFDFFVGYKYLTEGDKQHKACYELTRGRVIEPFDSRSQRGWQLILQL